MVTNFFIPDQFDIILIDHDPQLGSEMSKRRPCLVLSKRLLNATTKRVLVCPITSTAPQSYLHLRLPSNQKNSSGTILLDQIKSLDFKSRNAKKIDELRDLKLYDDIVELIALIIKR